jgi:hypothetical protein
MTWMPFDSGSSLGTIGSENGAIVHDFEHCSGARITIEQGGNSAPFSITCGIYGWFFHTRFLSTLEQAEEECAAMQSALSQIIAIIPLESDPNADSKMSAVSDAISSFVNRFP